MEQAEREKILMQEEMQSMQAQMNKILEVTNKLLCKVAWFFLIVGFIFHMDGIFIPCQ